MIIRDGKNSCYWGMCYRQKDSYIWTQEQHKKLKGVMILNQPSLISAFLLPPWLKSIKAEQESWGESWTTGTRAQNKNLFLIILKSCIPGQNCSIGVEIKMWKIKFTALLILQFPPLLSLTKPYNTQCGSKQSGALPNDLVPLFLVYCGWGGRFCLGDVFMSSGQVWGPYYRRDKVGLLELSYRKPFSPFYFK